MCNRFHFLSSSSSPLPSFPGFFCMHARSFIVESTNVFFFFQWQSLKKVVTCDVS